MTRPMLALLLGLPSWSTAGATEGPPVTANAQPDFDIQMGFDKSPLRPPSEGIVAGWTELPKQTRSLRKGWKLWRETAVPLHTDGGTIEWTYSAKAHEDDRLSIKVEVYQGGQQRAVEAMKAIGRSSNMPRNPFGPAPEWMRLGDFAAMPFPERASPTSPVRSVFWVYYNALVQAQVVAEHTQFDVLPVARAIQSFMEQHVVSDLPRHLPAVRGLSVPPEPAHVGDVVTLELVPESGTDVSSWLIRIDSPGQLLRGRASHDPLVALFEAEAPGRAILEAIVFDRKTLLSRRLEGAIEVLPASSRR